MKYLAEFLSTFTTECVIGLFTRYKDRAPKEITESWGMLQAAKKFVPNLDNKLVFVIGDGASPRTGALFAYYTKATVVSIDPAMNLDHYKIWYDRQVAVKETPQRLTVLKEKAENYKPSCNNKDILVVWPHSHADMNSFEPVGYSTRADIALPCCVKIPNKWLSRPHTKFSDENIMSEKNIVFVWN